MDKLCLFYQEVGLSKLAVCSSLELKEMQRAPCRRCGKEFTNKKGVKQHINRMHGQKSKGVEAIVDKVTLEENPLDVPNIQEDLTIMNNLIQSRSTVSMEPGIKLIVLDLTLEESVLSA